MRGSVALVTGAASGIGAAVSRKLTRAGARVAMLDVDEFRGRRLADDSPLRLNAICPGGVDTPIVPAALRAGGMAMMPVEVLAEDVLDLLQQGANGEIRLRMGGDQPARAVPVPALP